MYLSFRSLTYTHTNTLPTPTRTHTHTHTHTQILISAFTDEGKAPFLFIPGPTPKSDEGNGFLALSATPKSLLPPPSAGLTPGRYLYVCRRE